MNGGQFKNSPFKNLDMEKMDPMVWLLLRRKSGVFIVKRSDVRKDGEKKSGHVIKLKNRDEKAIVYDIVECHAMILRQKVLKICSGLSKK